MTELTVPRESSIGRGRNDAAPREVLLIVCAGVVLASLDLFIVNIALPQIAKDLHAKNLSDLSWVLNAYAIVYAALLVYFGRLADRYRRDRGFLLGVAIFTAASAACAAATSVGMLVAFRIVQAAGAALLTPTSLGLVLASYQPERRQGAVRAWTATGGMAAAIGPVIGGLLVVVDWRLVFLVNVPIGIAALIIGWRRLPHVPGHAGGHPDPFGVVLATAGVGLLTLGLVKGSDWGWSAGATLGALVGAAAMLAAFVAHCLRSAAPLIDPALFRSRQFSGATAVAVFFSAAFGAMLLSAVLWSQTVWHWSALRAGLALAPGPLMVPIVAFGFTGRLIARFGAAVVMAAGSIAFAVGEAWWALGVTVTPNYASGVLGGTLLTGVGVGLTLTTMMATGAAGLPAQAFATGSAVINTVRQTGLALGVAVLVAVIGSPDSPSAALHAFRHGWWVTAAISAAAVLPTLTLRRSAG